MRREAVPRREDASIELARVPLQLIAVDVDAAEEVGAAVDVEHDPTPIVSGPLAREVVGTHFDPLGAQRAAGAPPLPPCLAADLLNACGAELLLDCGCGGGDLGLGDVDFVDLDPCWVGDVLCGEALEVFHCVVGGVEEELADQGEPFVVRDVGCGFEGSCLAIEVLGRCQHLI